MSYYLVGLVVDVPLQKYRLRKLLQQCLNEVSQGRMPEVVAKVPNDSQGAKSEIEPDAERRLMYVNSIFAILAADETCKVDALPILTLTASTFS